MSDDSVLKGRVYTAAHIRTFVHPSRWPQWYRRKKPDHGRSDTDDYMYSNVNSETNSDIADQATHPYTYRGFINERVADDPDLWELIGQVPAKIFGARQVMQIVDNMQMKITIGRAIVPYDYIVELDDHFIQLEEDISVDNRKEWNVTAVIPRDGQFWSIELKLLVGVHG